MKKNVLMFVVLTAIATFIATTPAMAQGTAFTYQGLLQNNGHPASGTYNLTFSLFNTSSGGSSIAGPVTANGVSVSNGLFTVLIDFGSGVFSGATNWLELGVETNGVNMFTTMTPRQQLTPTPYAIFANTASNLSGTLPASQLSGVPGAAENFTGSLGGDISGTQGATVVSSVGGQTAANIAGGVVAANGATSASTPGAIVARDASGNFSAGSVTLGGSLYLPFPATIYSGGNTLFIEEGNTFLGLGAGPGCTGTGDVGLGDNSLAAVTTGSYNTAIGEQALTTTTTASDNTAVGFGALGQLGNYNISAPSGFNNIALGYMAGYNLVGDGSIYITNANNIDIGNQGEAGDSCIIRIGDPSIQVITYLSGSVVALQFYATSDRNAKENFTPVDGQAVLAKVAALPVTEWNYKTEGKGVQHIGPMAQDFQAAFQLGTDDKHISVVDEGGVALAAIQGLNQKLDEKDAEIKNLEKKLDELQAVVNQLSTHK